MSYRIRLRSTGFELELEGDREFVESKLADLSWLEKILDKAGAAAHAESRPLTSGRKPSFIEFASLMNPRTNGEKVLTIAYYLYKWENRDVTYEDIEQYYRRARWPMPGNVRDVMSNLIREGYMEDAGKISDRKAFRILQKGIKLIEEAVQRGGAS